MNEPDLNRLTIDQIAELERACRKHLETWFGFSRAGRDRQTAEFVEATKWRLEGKTEPCCECGEPYSTVDLHFGDHVFCPACREQERKTP